MDKLAASERLAILSLSHFVQLSQFSEWSEFSGEFRNGKKQMQKLYQIQVSYKWRTWTWWWRWIGLKFITFFVLLSLHRNNKITFFLYIVAITLCCPFSLQQNSSKSHSSPIQPISSHLHLIHLSDFHTNNAFPMLAWHYLHCQSNFALFFFLFLTVRWIRLDG